MNNSDDKTDKKLESFQIKLHYVQRLRNPLLSKNLWNFKVLKQY